MKSCKNCRYTDNMGRWPCDDCVSRDKWEEKPLTNADKIRAMKNKELANTLLDFQCTTCDFDGFCKSKGKCKKAIMDWLKCPMKEEE